MRVLMAITAGFIFLSQLDVLKTCVLDETQETGSKRRKLTEYLTNWNINTCFVLFFKSMTLGLKRYSVSKVFARKRKDLGLGLLHPHKPPGTSASVSDASTEERNVNPRACWNRQTPGSMRDPLSRNKVESFDEITASTSGLHVHMYTGKTMCTRMHTRTCTDTKLGFHSFYKYT